MLSASKLCQSSSTSGPWRAVAHPHEDVLQLALHLGDEVEVTARLAAPEREVEPVSARPRGFTAASSALSRRGLFVDPGGAVLDELPGHGLVGHVEDPIAFNSEISEPRPVNVRSAAASSASSAAAASPAAASSRYLSGRRLTSALPRLQGG